MTDSNQNIINAKINNYIPELIRDYIEDFEISIADKSKHSANIKAISDLVTTLKYWANNPENGTPALSQTELVKFKFITDILNDPGKILPPSSASLDNIEIIDVKSRIKEKLNLIADQLTQFYQLNGAQQATIDNQVTDWWSSKSQSERRKIQKQFGSLTTDEINELKKYANAQNDDDSDPLDPTPDPFWYYWMYAQCGLIILPPRMPILIAPVHIPHLGPGHGFNPHVNLHHGGGSHGIKGILGGVGGGHSSGTKDLGIVFLVVAAVLVAIAGIIGAIYSIKKIFNSLVNLIKGNKVFRSLYRLAGIGSGGYGGAIGGIILGALLGSVFPGLGTLAGAIIFGILGAGAGAGLGALITKYSAKLISYLFNKDELNPTNPEKYKLGKEEVRQLKAQGFDIDVVKAMIEKIHDVKQNADTISASFPFTDDRANKNALNNLLHDIKSHLDTLPERISIGDTTFQPYQMRLLPPNQNIQYILPEKYILNPGQKEHARSVGFDTTTIEQMLAAIYRENEREAGHISLSALAKFIRLNLLLDKLQNKPEDIKKFPIHIGKLFYDPRSSTPTMNASLSTTAKYFVKEFGRDINTVNGDVSVKAQQRSPHSNHLNKKEAVPTDTNQNQRKVARAK